MLTQIIQIDKQGRIELPQKMREILGLLPDADVIIELIDDGIFYKAKTYSDSNYTKDSQLGLASIGLESDGARD